MKTPILRPWLLLSAFSLQAFSLFCAAQPYQLDRTPTTPGITGNYYYEGYDAPNDRHVYVSDSGTYHYVDSGGNTTVGGTADLNTFHSPYRAIVSGTLSDFIFYNNNANNYTLNTITGTDGTVISATNFAVRSGTWFANNVTYTLNTGDGSGIWLEGVSGVLSSTAGVTGGNIVTYPDGTARVIYEQPVVFSGTNVNAIVNHTSAGSRQALSLRNGASAFIYGGTLSKAVAPGTVTVTGTIVTTTTVSGVVTSNTVVTTSTAFDTAASETIYLVGNQDGQGTSSHFHGEDLTIIASGPAVKAINLGNGHTTVNLYRSIITATNVANTEGGSTGGGPNAQVIHLNDQQNQGGAHFYGEDIIINNNRGRTFSFGYGANSITLKNSTITASGTSGAVFRWITSEGTGGSAGGNEAMADGFTSKVTLENTNVTTTANYAPIFQQTGRLGWATVTGGTITTTGLNSPIIRLVGANDARDESKFTGIFTNVLLDAQNSSAIDLDFNTRDSANYGEDGGGISKEVTTLITTAWDLIFISSTLNGTSAIRMATAGADNSPLGNETNVSVFNSSLNGRIEMLVSAGLSTSFETSGANLALRGFNSDFTGGFFMTGTEAARKYHQALIDLTDSTWNGDLVATNRGVALFRFVNTQVTGNFVFSGSTSAFLDLINSPIDGGIYLDGTATFVTALGLDINDRRPTIHNSAITGGVHLAGASHLDLILDGPGTIISNGITAEGTATGIFRFENNSSIIGGVTVSGSSSVTLILSDVNQLSGNLFINDRARLALATFAGTPIHLDRNIDLAGIWGITGKTTLGGLLDITHPLGTIAIENAGPDILTLSSGLIGNGRLDIVSIDDTTVGDDEIRVIHDPTGNFTPDAFILSHPVEYALIAYDIDNRADGAYLIRSPGLKGSGAAAVANSQALMVEDWLAALIPINNRLSELRQSNVAIFSGDTTGGPARGDAGAFWLQVRADTTKVGTGSDFRDFDSRTIGFTAGVEARWDSDTSSLSSGIFIDTARTARDFIETAEGSTSSVGGGFYIQYHHRKGFFASAIARFDTYETILDTNNPNNALKADYNSQALGAAIDIGWRFELANSGWWYEPAFQLAIASFPGVSYTTFGNDIDISTEDGRATQNILRFGFGKSFGQKWSFHGYLAAAKVNASGGELSAPFRAQFTIDGDRIEASIGMSRQIGRAGRLSLNATYVDSDKYQRPCIFSGGYSHAW